MKIYNLFPSIILWTVPQTGGAFNLFKSSNDHKSKNTGKVSFQSKFDANIVQVESKAKGRSKRNLFQYDKHQIDNINLTIRNTCISLALSCTMFFTPNVIDARVHDSSSPRILSNLHPPSALAADYGSLSAEQKLVAEAWRIVDGNFIDRTFNNQDWFKLRQDAVQKKYKTNQEATDAIDKIVGSLGDKYTRYLPQAKYRSIVDAATGTLAGVGVEISTDKDTGKIFASDVEPSSPAMNGGIKKGDVFVNVDGMIMDDGSATPDDVASKLRGPKGSRVGVVMEREGKTEDFILTREPITITSVRTYMSDVKGPEKVGVVRIKSFSGTTVSTVQNALEDLKKKGAQDFVLDLRNNPGGLLPGGTDTAGLFLEANKPLVFVVDKKGVVDAQSTFQDGIAVDYPLAIVVNGNTASAAEVMTAALKENERATIIGEQTFGKGIIQTIRQLSNDNGGVAVTVAKYETPQHNNINKQGIAVSIF